MLLLIFDSCKVVKYCLLTQGQVEATGSFEEIKNSGLNFAKLLSKEEEENLLVPTSPKQLEPSLLVSNLSISNIK